MSSTKTWNNELLLTGLYVILLFRWHISVTANSIAVRVNLCAVDYAGEMER